MNARIHERCFAEIANLRALASGLEQIAAEKQPCSPLHILELERRLFPETHVLGGELSNDEKRIAELIAELDQMRAENEAIRLELAEAGVHVV